MKNFTPVGDHMKKALDAAREGVRSGHGGPFGAVIVKGGKIIAAAHNTILKYSDPTRHAEMNAISEASQNLGSHDLSGCIIYSTTEPCPMCFSACHWARISAVVYGTSINEVAELGFNELSVDTAHLKEHGNSDVNIYSGFMYEECRRILELWEDLPDTQTY